MGVRIGFVDVADDIVDVVAIHYIILFAYYDLKIAFICFVEMSEQPTNSTSNPMSVSGVDRQTITEASQEAMNRALDYNPAERASLVRRMLREIPRAMSTSTEQELREQFKEFAEAYPELFKKIITRSDLTPIHTMLAMLDRIQEGSLNTHQASMIVGKRLLDRYVTPQVRGSGSDRQGH